MEKNNEKTEKSTEPLEASAKEFFRPSQERRTTDLVEASLLALGWISGGSGVTAFPVYPLAKALKGLGVNSSYLDGLIAVNEAPYPTVATPSSAKGGFRLSEITREDKKNERP